MSKRVIVVLVLLLVACFAAVASESGYDVSKAQRENVLLGFGIGSKHQGDLANARLLKNLDLWGTGLSVTGGISLAGSIFMVNALKAMTGEVTKADIYISAGVLVSGILMLIGSRIAGAQLPARY